MHRPLRGISLLLAEQNGQRSDAQKKKPSRLRQLLFYTYTYRLKSAVILVEFFDRFFRGAFSCRIERREIACGGLGKVASDRLERTACHITDIVDNAVLDKVHHFFRFFVTGIFGFERLFIERRDNVSVTVSCKSFGDSAGTVDIRNTYRNDNKRCSAVDSSGIFVVFVEFRVRNNTEIVVHVAKWIESQTKSIPSASTHTSSGVSLS